MAMPSPWSPPTSCPLLETFDMHTPCHPIPSLSHLANLINPIKGGFPHSNSSHHYTPLLPLILLKQSLIPISSTEPQSIAGAPPVLLQDRRS